MSFGPYHRSISKQAKQSFYLDWRLHLESGETIDSVTATWLDEDGNDASTLESGSAFIDGTRTYATKGGNAGTPGKYYYLIFTASTSEGRVLGGDQLGTIKLKITKNF